MNEKSQFQFIKSHKTTYLAVEYALVIIGILLCLLVTAACLTTRLLGRANTGQHFTLIFLLLICGIICALFSGIYLIKELALNRRYLKHVQSLLKTRDFHKLEQEAPADSAARYLLLQASLFADLLASEDTSEKLEHDKKLIRLRSQINPHFLYNTIDSIRSQALIEGFDTVANMLEAFSIMARDTLKADEVLRPLEQELNSIVNYVSIQQYRLNNRFSITYDIDRSDYELMAYPLPTLSLQPLVENALFHGLEPCVDGGVITVHAEKNDRYVRITVSDNGVGIPGDQLAKINNLLSSNLINLQGDTGIALTNINARIKNYYGEEYGLHLRSLVNFGTIAELLLPVGGPQNA